MTIRLGCYMLGWRWGEGCHRRPSMPLLLNWVCVHQNHDKSSVLTLCSMREHGSRAYMWFLQQHRLRTWSPAPSHAIDLSVVSSGRTDHGYHMVFCRCMGHRPYYSPWRQHRPGTSTGVQAAAQATNINIDPSCRRTTDPDMALGSSMDLDKVIYSEVKQRTERTLHPCTLAPLSTCTSAYLHPYTPVPLYTCSPAQCTPAHMHTCIPVLLHTCTPAHMHPCTPVPLHQAFVPGPPLSICHLDYLTQYN